MTATTLDGHMGTALTVDICTSCQAIWFDTYESLQLAPASTLKLFSLIGEHAHTPKLPSGRNISCPRCQARLLLTHDRQRDTPFHYWRCDARHGRLITFFNFLREKHFVKPLSPAEIAELRQNIQTVNCSNCGGPIDLVKQSVCPHCGSPVSMLDMKQAEKLVAQLKDAAAPREIDPALPLNLMRARREAEAAFAAMDKNRDWWHEASSNGLVEASVTMIARWLNQRA